MINIPKGTKDVLPADSYKWQYVEGVARETARLFNLKEIRTPVFEHTEVFLRGVGDTTDIVTKEMYTFRDKGDRSITLKPEGTAGVAPVVYRKRTCGRRLARENVLYHSRVPLRAAAGGPTARISSVRRGNLRRRGRGYGRGGNRAGGFPAQKPGIAR